MKLIVTCVGPGNGSHDEETEPLPEEALQISHRWNPVSGHSAGTHQVSHHVWFKSATRFICLNLLFSLLVLVVTILVCASWRSNKVLEGHSDLGMTVNLHCYNIFHLNQVNPMCLEINQCL